MDMPKNSMLHQLWDDGNQYRRSLLRTMLWIMAVISIGLALSNFSATNGQPFIIIEMSIGIYCLVFLKRLKQITHLRLWSLILLLTIFALIAGGIATKAMHVDGFFWLLLMPPLSLLLLGLLRGAIMTLLFGIVGVILVTTTQRLPDNSLDVPLLVNAIVSYLSIWAMSHVYETCRLNIINKLQHAAAHDPLTGLYNRLHLENIFQRLRAHHQKKLQSFALLLIDVDYFKQLNDRFGHEVGDNVLADLASRMRQLTHENDWLFRVGGEEFCILLPNHNQEQAFDCAELIRRTVAEHRVTCQQKHVSFTISVGIAMWPLEGENLDALYRSADNALYQAKHLGRNQTVTNEEQSALSAISAG